MDIIDLIIQKVGKKIIVGTPLGAGKPNTLLNALYKRAKIDSSLSLTIYSALTLNKPKGKSFLEKRFMAPFVDRVFKGYPDLDYENDRIKNQIPNNIKIIEFYYPAGKFMGNSYAQRNYLCSNYTHAARDINERGINVLLQQIAPSTNEEIFSLSCNADITLEVLASMRKREKDHGIPSIFVGQVNKNLPFMLGDALISRETFDYIVDSPEGHFPIFGTPKTSISDADYMIGLFASTLIKDDGELQVGIGALGDSLTYHLIQRHKNNNIWKRFLEHLGVEKRYSEIINKIGDRGTFSQGLFAATEMMIDGFLYLYKNEILKKKVYDDIKIQRLVNEGVLKDQIPKGILKIFLQKGIISNPLTEININFLKKFGIFKPQITFERGKIFLEDGSSFTPDLNDPDFFNNVDDKCLGDKLNGGQIVHGGFFLGPNSFYDELRKMPLEEKILFNMRSVTKINQLYGHEEIDRLHRKNARFVNSCMKVTLNGSVVSDGLENGQVVSGVGGQYNFVSMAHELEGGRSILLLRSTKNIKGKALSNIVWNYGHMTIPRHLRDIIITEYGIADLRSKTDEEIIAELLNITDSQFQEKLLKKAKQMGKISLDYEIPQIYRNNFPHVYEDILKEFKKLDFFPPFPFGNDFTPEELEIGKALKWLKKKTETKFSKIFLVIRALFPKTPLSNPEILLKRMDLAKPKNFREYLYKNLLIIGLEKK